MIQILTHIGRHCFLYKSIKTTSYFIYLDKIKLISEIYDSGHETMITQ